MGSEDKKKYTRAEQREIYKMLTFGYRYGVSIKMKDIKWVKNKLK